MTRTFQDDVAADFAGILNADTGFAQTVYQYPQGVVAAAVEHTAIFAEGPSERVDDEHGDRLRRTGTLYIPRTVTVTANERHGIRDTFLIAGEIWDTVFTRKPIGSQEVELVRFEPITTKRSRAN